MRDIPGDLGQRILEAARLAVQMHVEATLSKTQDAPQYLSAGGAGSIGVRDDAPAGAISIASGQAERKAA
jgi:hypothetical protein